MRSNGRFHDVARRSLAALAGLLLTLQIAIGFFPADPPLEDGDIRVVICDGGAMRTVTISLIDGTLRTHSQPGDLKCPLCVAGAVALALPATLPAWLPAVLTASYDETGEVPVLAQAEDRAQPIRAPPLVL
ncbi:MAG: DUF2946 family protein [Tabrizicola sp.]